MIPVVQGRKIDPVQKRSILRDLEEGFSTAETARRHHLNYSTVYYIKKGGWKAFPSGGGTGVSSTAKAFDNQTELPVPKVWDDLTDEAKRAHGDIVYFARRYFGAILLPWQLEATTKIMRWYESDDREYVCVNAPPGSGKSFFFTRILPCFLTVRNRAIRGMIGSASHSVAERYVMQIRRELERTVPRTATDSEKKLGISVDAESTLPKDFGFFKPTISDVWRANAFVVAQPDDTAVLEKEPTWSAVGPDTAFIGGRFEFVIWDDLWDPQKLRSLDSIQRLKDWYSEVAEARVEPGGLMILQGQRFGADDIYRYALDQTMGADASLFDEDELSEGWDSEKARYRHLKYKAHYEDLCDSRRHQKKQAPWPDSCLLAPRRLPYTFLAPIKENRGDQYEVVYQQSDVDPAEVLVPAIWITGGSDAHGAEFPGCEDKDRDLCELPADLDGDLISIVTADPSPTMFWSIQWWILQVQNGEVQQFFLMDMLRQKMSAPEFLDWDQSVGKHVGVAEEWQSRSRQLGWPITHWIVEKNAAQRFLLQFAHMKTFQSKWGVEVLGHETHKNKADPEFGVQSIAPHFRWGRMRLPRKNKSPGRVQTQQMIYELTHYPKSTTDDAVMSTWFCVFWAPELVNVFTSSPVRQWRPKWFGKKVKVPA